MIHYTQNLLKKNLNEPELPFLSPELFRVTIEGVILESVRNHDLL